MNAVRISERVYSAGGALLCLLFPLIFSASCSIQRLNQESLHLDERLEDRAEWKRLEDNVRADWLNVRYLLRLSDESRQVWIWPEGEFSFQLDSGFVGSASVLLVGAIWWRWWRRRRPPC